MSKFHVISTECVVKQNVNQDI